MPSSLIRYAFWGLQSKHCLWESSPPVPPGILLCCLQMTSPESSSCLPLFGRWQSTDGPQTGSRRKWRRAVKCWVIPSVCLHSSVLKRKLFSTFKTRRVICDLQPCLDPLTVFWISWRFSLSPWFQACLLFFVMQILTHFIFALTPVPVEYFALRYEQDGSFWSVAAHPLSWFWPCSGTQTEMCNSICPEVNPQCFY